MVWDSGLGHFVEDEEFETEEPPEFWSGSLIPYVCNGTGFDEKRGRVKERRDFEEGGEGSFCFGLEDTSTDL